MLHQTIKDFRTHFSYVLLACLFLFVCGCTTTKGKNYYVRKLHNENLTEVTAKDGLVLEKEISFQQYLEETKR